MLAKKVKMKETLLPRICREHGRQLELASWAPSVFQGCKLERNEEWLDLHFARNKTKEATLLPVRSENFSLVFYM